MRLARRDYPSSFSAKTPCKELMSPTPFPASSLRNAALLYGGMTALAVALALPLRAGLAVFTLPDLPLAWLAGLTGGLLLLAISWLAERVWPRFRALGDTMAALLGPVTPGQAALLALLSGIGEEALFRGPIQIALGPLAATLLFAGLHGLGNRRLWPWPLVALLAGALFAALAWQFHSLWPGAVAHVVVNAVNLRRLGLRYTPRAASGTDV